MNIKDLTENPSLLSADTLPQLKALVEQYPFYQTARLLYIANLYQQHDSSFGAELRKASLFVPDRTALFALTEGVNYQLPTTDHDIIETESDSNRTLTLINTFLNTGSGIQTSEDDEDAQRSQPTVADLTNDYASFLIQQDRNANATEAPPMKGANLIDTFIQETQGKQRLPIPEEQNSGEFTSPVLSDDDEEIYTESMVNIYIKQGRYQQALEILRKISLNNPKKSTNFAAQIKLLEIILQSNP